MALAWRSLKWHEHPVGNQGGRGGEFQCAPRACTTCMRHVPGASVTHACADSCAVHVRGVNTCHGQWGDLCASQGGSQDRLKLHS